MTHCLSWDIIYSIHVFTESALLKNTKYYRSRCLGHVSLMAFLTINFQTTSQPLLFIPPEEE